MITREQIETGIQQKIVRFIVDPNMRHGTVCEIGEHWFYFGGETAEEENPEQFLRNSDMSDVVNSVVEALRGIEELDDYEYGYYEAVLKENLSIGDWQGIETLKERDKKLERLWEEFADVPMDPETECMEEPFVGFPAGTHREDIWHWFDERHSKGVAHLLYRDGVDRTSEMARICYLKQLCFECESLDCYFNHGGECRFAMVHERKPTVTMDDGCTDYDYQEGDQ